MTEYQVTQIAWVFGILWTGGQAAIWKWCSRSFIATNPQLRDGYSRLIRGWLVWANVPWVVLGIGSIAGALTLRDLAGLRLDNPFVLAFVVAVLVEWVLTVRWLYFRDGAELLAQYPGLLSASSPIGIKLYAGTCLLGGVVGLMVLWLKSR